MKFRLNNEEVTLSNYRSMKQSSELKLVSLVNHIEESSFDVPIKQRLGIDTLVTVMMNFESVSIQNYDELVATLHRFEFHSIPKILELDMTNIDSPPARPSI